MFININQVNQKFKEKIIDDLKMINKNTNKQYQIETKRYNLKNNEKSKRIK